MNPSIAKSCEFTPRLIDDNLGDALEVCQELEVRLSEHADMINADVVSS